MMPRGKRWCLNGVLRGMLNLKGQIMAKPPKCCNGLWLSQFFARTEYRYHSNRRIFTHGIYQSYRIAVDDQFACVGMLSIYTEVRQLLKHLEHIPYRRIHSFTLQRIRLRYLGDNLRKV